MDIPQPLYSEVLRYPICWISMDIQPPLSLRNIELRPALCQKTVDVQPSLYSSILDIRPPQFQKHMDLRPPLPWSTIDTRKPLYVKCAFIHRLPAKHQEGYIFFQQSETVFLKDVHRVIFFTANKSSKCQQCKSVKIKEYFAKQNLCSLQKLILYAGVSHV